MKLKTLQIIAITLSLLLILNPLVSTETSKEETTETPTNNNQEENIEQTSQIVENIENQISEKIQTKTSVQEENKEISNEILVEIDNIEYETVNQKEASEIQNKETFTVPIEEIINKSTKETNNTIKNISQEISNTTELQNTSLTNRTTNKTSTHINQIIDNAKNTNEKQNTTTINTTTTSTVEKTQEKVWTTLLLNKKIEMEGIIPENFDINSIEKKESIIDEQSKEVIVKSGEHLSDPLTVYTDIPEVKKEQISYVEVFWVNEEKEVDITGFYDLDNNGLYDRISWVVPHLSEQIFEIKINLIEEDNISTEIKIYKKDPTPNNGEIVNTNYIEFKFSLNYTNTSAIHCNFEINTTPSFFKEITTTSSWETNLTELPDGSYSWHLLCYDSSNFKINESIQGYFEINEEYYVEEPRELYVLDWNNNIKNNPDTKITITSAQSTTKQVTIIKEGTTIYGPQNITSNEFDLEPHINQSGEHRLKVDFYRLHEPTTIEKEFSVATANIQFSNTDIEINEELEININLDSTNQKKISWIILESDGNAIEYKTGINSDSFDSTFTHEFSSAGTYDVDLEVGFVGVTETYTFSRNGITVTDPGDNEVPDVDLISPKNNEKINETEITFSYKVNDDSKVKNCTFELYMYENGVGTLEDSQVTKNPKHNTKIKLPYEEFEEGEYSWNIYCCDNESNCNDWDTFEREFEVVFGKTTSTKNENKDYPEKEEIEKIIENLNSFMNLQDSLSLEEKDALNDLGITENLTFYKKRLTQIDQDLATNIKFISSETLKEERRQELIQEYTTIKKNIPINFEVTQQKEFSKNSITKNLEELVKEYSDLKNIEIDSNSIKKLSEINQQIQTHISVSTISKKIVIDFLDNSKKLTLITKSFDLKNNSFSTILEYLPTELENPIFITDSEKLNKNMYEIQIDDLDENKIIYYVEDHIDLEKTQDTDTILFENFIIKDTKITGLFFLGEDFGNSFWAYIIFIILIAGITYLGSYVVSKTKMSRYKKEEDVNRIIIATKKAKSALQSNDVEQAKEIYSKLKELYLLVPKGFKKNAYKEIKKIRIGIDRREIIGLVKEHEKALKENRKQDAERIYLNVKKTYKRLPKKDQEKIYNKMFKDNWEI